MNCEYYLSQLKSFSFNSLNVVHEINFNFTLEATSLNINQIFFFMFKNVEMWRKIIMIFTEYMDSPNHDMPRMEAPRKFILCLSKLLEGSLYCHY